MRIYMGIHKDNFRITPDCKCWIYKGETQKKRVKQFKPYLTCTWYPWECNAVGCDQCACRDYKKE